MMKKSFLVCWAIGGIWWGTSGCGPGSPTPGPPKGIAAPKLFCLADGDSQGSNAQTISRTVRYEMRDEAGHPIKSGTPIPIEIEAVYCDGDPNNLWPTHGLLGGQTVVCPGPNVITASTDPQGIVAFTVELATTAGNFLPDGPAPPCASGSRAWGSEAVGENGPKPIVPGPHSTVGFPPRWNANHYAEVVGQEGLIWSVQFLDRQYAEGAYCGDISCGQANKLSPAAQLALTQPICDCGPLGMDIDEDGDVDQSDFGIFQVCYDPLAPTLPTPSPCQCFDLDDDGVVGLNDFGLFQRCLSGPGLPADPTCLQ